MKRVRERRRESENERVTERYKSRREREGGTESRCGRIRVRA